MKGQMEPIVIILIAITVVTSIQGFRDARFFERYKFNVGAILSSKQWDRLISSAFLHGDYMHLFFNMFTLFFFSNVIVRGLGLWQYLTIYFAAVIGGGLLSLWMHRKDYYYSAIGASGGVVGILFAAIALNPHIGIGIMFIPVAIPGWIFAIIYLGYSIYGMRSQLGNIGHDAHLGGAVIGLALAILLNPSVLYHNGLYIGIMTIPLIVLAYLVWQKK